MIRLSLTGSEPKLFDAEEDIVYDFAIYVESLNIFALMEFYWIHGISLDS